MPSQKFSGLAKEARSLVAFCEESLSLIGRYVVASAYLETGAMPPSEGDMEGGSQDARLHHETARRTRALAGEVSDPEVRRLLCALADRYEELAATDGGRNARR